MRDVVVIGAGLFGSIIARALRKTGRTVMVIDDQRPDAGSKPAACLMRPSWFSSLGSAIYKPSLQLLNELYGLKDISFRTAVGRTTVHWCDPASILKAPDLVATVRHVRGGKNWLVTLDSGVVEEARSVIVAAGVWTPALTFVQGGIVGQAGLACLWPQEQREPSIRVWAPYRQLVAFNRGDGLWVGDGSAVRMDRWTTYAARAVEKRCTTFAALKTKPKLLYGVRPYSKAKPCYLTQPSPGLWVATGGAKNGTLAAGWCASEIVRLSS